MNILQIIADPLFYSNCFVVSCPSTNEGIIIDPGSRIEEIGEEIEKNKVTPIAVVNTHGHIDHIGRAAEAKEMLGVPFMLHEEEKVIIDDLPGQAARWGLKSVEIPSVDRWLKDGDTIEIGEQILEVIHTPGHSPGGISLYGNGHLFSGDTLFAGSIGRTDFKGGDYETLITSIRKRILTLPPETLVHSGHGPDTTVGAEAVSNPFLQ